MWLLIKIQWPRKAVPLDFKTKNSKIASSLLMMKYSIRACHLQGKVGFHDWCFTGCISTHKSLLVRQHWGAVKPHDCISLCCNAASNYIASAGTKEQISQTNSAQTSLCAVASVQCWYICIMAQDLHLQLFFTVGFKIITVNLLVCCKRKIFVLRPEGSPLFTQCV